MKQQKPILKKANAKKRTPAKAARPSRFSLSNLSHTKLIIISGVLVGLIFGGVGAWTISNSSAASISSSTCSLLGRYSTGGFSTPKSCSNSCKPGAGSIKTGSTYNYCSGAISATTNSEKCSGYGRRYVSGAGCARLWTQKNLTKGASQCANSSHTYYVEQIDYCDSRKRPGSARGTIPYCSSNSRTVYNYLRGVGFSKNQSVGILGNLWAESDVLPTKKQNSGTPTYSPVRGIGFGIAQWSTPDRQQKLVAWAKARGQSVATISPQESFLYNELTTSPLYKPTYNKIRATSSYDTAARAFMTGFEGPRDQSSSAQGYRVSLAEFFTRCY